MSRDKKNHITILCENTAGHSEGLIGEHGFAAIVENKDDIYLFDTGQGIGLLGNSVRLGFDLRKIDGLIISHGHWDHTGGLSDLLNLYGNKLKIYSHPDIFSERYYEKDGQLRDAGIRFNQRYFESFGAEFVYNTSRTDLSENMFITGEIPRTSDFEKDAPQLKIKVGDSIVTDKVNDEQCLVISTPKGLVILLGCGHPGIINIIQYAIEITGITKVAAVIGGTHLMFTSEDQLLNSIKMLGSFDIDLIGTSHCTGGYANSLIRSKFPEKFIECNVGRVLSF